MEVDLANQAVAPAQSAWVATLRNVWQWVLRVAKPRTERRLRLRETLSLGERRFAAVIEFNGQEFLVGGSGSSFELLARFQDGKVVTESSKPDGSQRLEKQ